MKKINPFLMGISLAFVLTLSGCNNGDNPIDTNNSDSIFPTKGIVYMNGAIWSMNYDGSNKKEIASEDGFASALSSSPDGTKVIYHLRFTGLIVLDGKGKKSTITNDDLIPDDVRFSWANNGKIYFNRYRSFVTQYAVDGRYIFSMKEDGSSATQITPYYTDPDLLSDHNPQDGSPSISPDNSAIVFTTQRSGNMGVIAKITLSTSTISYLTYSGGLNNSGTMGVYTAEDPSFSPDGTKIVFVGAIDNTLPAAEQDHIQVFIMNADGSGKTSLTHHTIENCTYPSWSPDGKLIVFQKDSVGYAKICVIKPDGSGEKVIADNGVYPCFIGQSK